MYGMFIYLNYGNRTFPSSCLPPPHSVDKCQVFLTRITSCLPHKISRNRCLQFLLEKEDVQREIENNAYAKFWG